MKMSGCQGLEVGEGWLQHEGFLGGREMELFYVMMGGGLHESLHLLTLIALYTKSCSFYSLWIKQQKAFFKI